MIETKDRVIDGLHFYTTQLPPLKAYPLSARVAKIIGPVLEKLADVVKDLKSFDEEEIEKLFTNDIRKLAPAGMSLVDALAKSENEDLPLKLLAGTRVQIFDENQEPSLEHLANPDAFNRVFQGRLLTLYKAMWFSVGVNFRDFFPGARKGDPTKGSPEKTANP